MPTGPHLQLTYDYVEDIVERRAPHREEHLKLIAEWQEQGRLVLAGAVGDPPHGATFILAADADPHEFTRRDPYVLNELVTRWRADPINVVAAPA
jgi:uncharacterized protein YciI